MVFSTTKQMCHSKDEVCAYTHTIQKGAGVKEGGRKTRGIFYYIDRKHTLKQKAAAATARDGGRQHGGRDGTRAPSPFAPPRSDPKEQAHRPGKKQHSRPHAAVG